MTDGSGEACCSDNPVQSLDKLAPDEVSAPKSCGLHAFSADIAPKSCRHLVPNHFVEARNLLVEAFCSGVEAFCCDDLVQNLDEEARNDLFGLRKAGCRVKNLDIASMWCKNHPMNVDSEGREMRPAEAGTDCRPALPGMPVTTAPTTPGLVPAAAVPTLADFCDC
ncbi:MAG TPA: hypothetical protein PK144_12770, partial [Plasticicumulans sp.]|nr:hypothetical protein [Plasticicumulans sp.]